MSEVPLYPFQHSGVVGRQSGQRGIGAISDFDQYDLSALRREVLLELVSHLVDRVSPLDSNAQEVANPLSGGRDSLIRGSRPHTTQQ